MDDKFLTGHAGIDQQHRILFAIIDRLTSTQQHDLADDIQTALDLIKYVIQHFSYEEHLMTRSGYSGAPRHLENHRQISLTVAAYKDRMLRGEDAHAELATFVDTWIKHHIGEEDQLLAKHLATLNGTVPAA